MQVTVTGEGGHGFSMPEASAMEKVNYYNHNLFFLFFCFIYFLPCWPIGIYVELRVEGRWFESRLWTKAFLYNFFDMIDMLSPGFW